MSYTIKIDFSPSYELISSYSVFTKRNLTRHLLYGEQWIKDTEIQIGEELTKEILAFKEHCWLEYFTLLVYIWDKKEGEPAEFLKWVKGLQPGELFEYLSPYVLSPLEPHIGAMKDQFVELLTQWNESYFKKFDLLEVLKKNAVEVRKLSKQFPSVETVDKVTDLWIGYEANLDKMVLVPSIHANPIKFIYKFNGLNIINYPVDPPVGEGELPYKIKRLTKALNDDNRIRILQLVAQGPKTFTDLVNELGLSKATVHQHLYVLRSAGLLRLHYYQEFYTINPEIFEKVKSILVEQVFGVIEN